MKQLVEDYNKKFQNSSPLEVLEFFLEEYKNKITFATSLGAEDQVITDLIHKSKKECYIFTLDTGRLFYEAYSLIESTNEKYKININIYSPNHFLVEKMVSEDGINLFYKSVDLRKKCCNIRKIEPLRRALAKHKVWICGLRKEQSVTRSETQMIEWDESNGMIKLNPLINWSEEEVWDYIKKNVVPYNTLHDKGYLSIGCAPCTRAVPKGKDIRAGRWWWENPEQKECGLHAK